MAFTEDFSEFTDTDDFGVTATVGGVDVDGILDKEYVEVAGAQGYAPVFVCAEADVSSVAEGASYAIGTTTYYQVRQEPDGTGMTTVILREV